MSRSMLCATFALLVSVGWLLPSAHGQQRFKPVASGGTPKVWQNKSVTAPPRSLQLAPPKLPNNWQPELRPPAFGPAKAYIPPARIPNYVPAPIAPNKAPQSYSRVPEKYGVVRVPRVDSRHQRPQGPGQQPAGNPWIARSNQRIRKIANTRIDREVMALTPHGEHLSSGVPGANTLPSGPAGNAAPVLGSRGLAADGFGASRNEQNRVWLETARAALAEDSTLMPDSRGGITMLLPDGTGWERRHWNDAGYLQDDRVRFGTNSAGQTTVTHSSFWKDKDQNVQRSSVTKAVDGPIASWSHWPTQRVTSEGGNTGESKGIYGGQGAGNHGSAPQTERPVKELGTNGGPKSHSSSSGAEGTDGLGVAGGSGSPFPQREGVGDVQLRTQPDSVISPTGPDDRSISHAFIAPPIAAPPPHAGGYIPAQRRPMGGKQWAAQPASDSRGLPASSEPLSVELLRDAVTNPVPAP